MKADTPPSRKQLELLLAVFGSVLLAAAAVFFVDSDYDLSKREAFFLVLLVLGGVVGTWNFIRAIWTGEKRNAACFQFVAFVGGLVAGLIEWRILSALWPRWWQDEIFLLMFLNVVAAGVLEARWRR